MLPKSVMNVKRAPNYVIDVKNDSQYVMNVELGSQYVMHVTHVTPLKPPSYTGGGVTGGPISYIP